MILYTLFKYTIYIYIYTHTRYTYVNSRLWEKPRKSGPSADSGTEELLLSVPGALMGFPHAFFGPTPLAPGRGQGKQTEKSATQKGGEWWETFSEKLLDLGHGPSLFSKHFILDVNQSTLGELYMIKTDEMKRTIFSFESSFPMFCTLKLPGASICGRAWVTHIARHLFMVWRPDSQKAFG